MERHDDRLALYSNSVDKVKGFETIEIDCTTCRWPNPSSRSQCPRTTRKLSRYTQAMSKAPSLVKCASRR
ncbi:hypothetical protein FIBSPDRAFT_571204 [Athelia psychrophila]|uniref:Uncharacterized protein n=1 Tax=Athelia psychrophila TaxID=1759441 RepID=A0A166HT12_9AGAM|nr:hypothetical protein FIBSPDRAFT_571204 [Fibularhizoctonia sp. CBS 109695]